MSKNIDEEREQLEELAGSDWSVLVARFGRATEAQIKEEADWMWPSDDNEEFAHRLYEALQVLQDNRENDMNFEQAMRTIKKGQNSDEANQAIAAAIAAGSVRGEWSGKKWESTYVGDWIAAGDLTGNETLAQLIDEWDEEDE